MPLTLISDGILLNENMKKANKDQAWLNKLLRKKHCTLQDTWLLTVDGEDQIVFYRKEGK